MDDLRRPMQTTREKAPCFGCTERFLACSDRCPKDARGERGYKAWKADLNSLNAARRERSLKMCNRMHGRIKK